jgi:DNA-binding SARP family transcriptional activator/tetratricopeptide (TPR) repeat protein
MLRIRLLGDVTARVHGDGGEVAVDVGHERQRCVLAALLVEPGRPVPADVLLERAWGDRLPQHPREALYSYVSRLRQSLAVGGCTVVRRPAGYLVEIDPLGVDLHLFDDLVRRAAAADDASAAELLDAALRLWTGDAFGGLDTPWLNSVRCELHRRRRTAERRRDDVALRLGRHAAVVDGMLARADAEPFDEGLASSAMLALYRCGRRGEALQRYDGLRRQLAGQLGIEPGDEVRRLYKRILDADPGLTAQAPWHQQVPQQLPAAPGAFTGRAAQLAELTVALAGGATQAVAVVAGAGGIGKTWLALRWAHEHLDAFPDGQLAVDLRGFDPVGEPLCPAAAIRGFLAALGVTAETLPAGGPEQAALYRRLVAGRRMLVLLDNAHDSAQVVPLLPGSPTVAVLVTSRRRLTGLVAAHGARAVTVECMDGADAAELLRARLGAARVAGEPEAVEALLPLCGGLPLALGIVAARAATDPRCRLATLAAELATRRTRLDALDAGDLAVSLRAAMAGSVRHLSPPAATLFGRLSLAPGPDIGAAAAASMSGPGPDIGTTAAASLTGPGPDIGTATAARMAGPGPGAQRAAVRELLDASLLGEEAPGRFRMHDLVRLYGIERAAADAGARAAVERLLDHYVHTACGAALRLEPLRDPLDLPEPLPGVRPETFPDRPSALAWFAAEDQVLPSAVRYADGAGFHRHAWQLAWAMVYALDQRGSWHAQVGVHKAALRSALRLADDVGVAHSHRGLARAYTWLRCYDEAREQLRAALAAYQRLGDLAGQGFAYRGLARVSAWQGEPGRALADDRRALAMFEAAGHDHGRAQTLNALGWHLAHLGEHDEAVACCGRAIAVQQRLRDRHGEGFTWDTLAFSRHRSGRPEEAVDCYLRSVALLAEHGDRYQEAVVTGHLGDAYATLGRAAEARTAWLRSAGLLDALGHPDARVARAKVSAGAQP